MSWFYKQKELCMGTGQNINPPINPELQMVDLESSDSISTI